MKRHCEVRGMALRVKNCSLSLAFGLTALWLLCQAFSYAWLRLILFRRGLMGSLSEPIACSVRILVFFLLLLG
jgi:hypothetical protein